MTRTEFNMHRSVLSAAVVQMADHVTKHSGVIWVPTPEYIEPTMDSICKAWREALDATGEYRVWSGGSTDTIYDTPDTNLAHRFWHDYMHFSTGYDLSVKGEEKVGLSMIHHMADVLGIDRGGARDLLYADSIGQVYYFQKHGAFPDNQREFVFDFVNAKYADGSIEKVLAYEY